MVLMLGIEGVKMNEYFDRPVAMRLKSLVHVILVKLAEYYFAIFLMRKRKV